MNLGEWVIEACEELEEGYIYRIDSDTQQESCFYQIYIRVVPALSGERVIRKLVYASADDDGFTPNYEYESIMFAFSGGKLISFFYNSPHDVEEVIEEKNQVLPFDEVVENHKNVIRGKGLFASSHPEGVNMEVTMDDIRVGLFRTGVKDGGDGFVLVPAISVTGDAWYTDQEGVYTETIKPDIVISAVDGSILYMATVPVERGMVAPQFEMGEYP